jgi:curved DNA-binding protein
MDYYSILGVGRNASPEEIKRAYRKLAMKHHPDRGGDTQTLAQINEAYDTLKDPQKRQQYDTLQTQHQYRYNTQNNPFGPGFEDIFSQAFGFNPNMRRQRRNRDVQISYTIEFKDIFTGRGISVAYNLPSGRQEFLDVKIPAGIKDGDIVNFTGYGDDSFPNIPRGNLILKIRVPTNPIWKRSDDNLTAIKKLCIFDLILGTDLIIETPTGKLLNLNIPQGTKPGTTFSIAGHGVPNVNTSRQGNLYIKIDTTIPKIEDKDLLDKIEEIKNAIS